MALKAFIKSLEGLDEAIQALYVETQGGFILDVSAGGGFALEDISGLKSALEKVKGERDRYRERSRSFMIDDEEISSDDALKAIARVKELEQIDPEAMADEKVKAKLLDMNRRHETEMSVANTERDSARGELEVVLVENAATSAIHDAGGNIKLLLPHVKSQVRMVRDDSGRPQVKVVDDVGNTRIHVEHGRTSDMSIIQLVTEMSETDDFMTAFDGSGKPGSGQNHVDDHHKRQNQAGHVDADDLGSLRATDTVDPIADIAAGKLVVDMPSQQ